MVIFIALAAIAFLLVVFVIRVYNRLITLRNRYKNSFSQIEVQLKRRYDLIPNLVETAKGYLAHERQTLEAVTAARNQAMAASQRLAGNLASPEAMKAVTSAESALTGTLGRLLAVAENYPDLKANQNMMVLMEELTSTENKISFARQAYNDMVMEYNNTREVFPNNMLSGTFGFVPAQLFETEAPEERKAVKVSFTGASSKGRPKAGRKPACCSSCSCWP
jgi:LemA protein